MIDVICTRWDNKYSADYVYTLKSMVHRNLAEPHRFICVTPHNLPGIDCEKPTETWPGTWQVISLFDREKPFLFIGLSTVIVGSLDGCVNMSEFYAAPVWDRDNLNSNLMWVEDAHDIYDEFDPAWMKEKSQEIKIWGNITAIERVRMPLFYPEEIMLSYKEHLQYKKGQEKILEKAVIVHCNGVPNPHEVREPWIKKHWQ